MNKQVILRHLVGNADDCSDVVGIYPLLPDDTCRLIVFDFDHHDKDEDKQGDNNWREEVDALREICARNGVDALVERSRSGNGAHIWIFFQKAIPAGLARKFGFALLQKGAESVNLKTFRYYDRLLPMQDQLPPGGLGNLIALPLQGQALKEGNSAFVDKNWNAYSNQWKVLFEKAKLSRTFIEKCVQEWGWEDASGKENQTGEKPWKADRLFHQEDVDGKIRIVLADGIYIETDNLRPRIQNRIRRLAAFNNPGYFKNQAMGLSNYANSRVIYLGRDESGFLRIPRGLLDELKYRCEEGKVAYSIDDQRCAGRNIRANFTGILKDAQVPAVAKMLETECGILSAATAFGKTVVCAKLIAERRVNTLILLQSSALVEQWENALAGFLAIDEELPEYKTPTGRKKRRKSLIGRIQGSHDSSTGIIDIAMVGSLLKKGEYHHRLKDYGMVILDECHHAASDTIAGVLEEVQAKYVYGVTATPMRGDGLEKANYMLIGPIRYSYSAKDRAIDQNIPHWVFPRFTRTVMPKLQKEKMHPNEAYELIRDNAVRDEMILQDVRLCIQNGRTPVVLSQYRDHSQQLYEKLNGCADSIFLLTGRNSKKEHKRILQQMSYVPPDNSMILVATGKLIGEGFDYPRLDTLIMATPVAGRGIVEQYAGRLNRDYEGKQSVIVFDYVDIHIPMFDKMYAKRLKAYKQIGYEVCSGLNNGKQAARSIYDIDSYDRAYQRDLLEARQQIIISSPAISKRKVLQLISLLRERQEAGVKVIIVTWSPESYRYGDSAMWMELQEHMRLAGFELNLTEEHCERFAIVDQEIVWYGSMNLLAKEDVEDNLMRVRSREIAAELLELTFGKNGPNAILPLE